MKAVSYITKNLSFGLLSCTNSMILDVPYLGVLVQTLHSRFLFFFLPFFNFLLKNYHPVIHQDSCLENVLFTQGICYHLHLAML